MSVQAPEKIDTSTATRIRRIREAFSEARTTVGLKDAPEVLCSGFEEIIEVP
jgi:hypothetical protein